MSFPPILFISVLLLGLSSCVLPTATDTGAQHEALQLIDRGVAHLRENELDKAEASFHLAYEIAHLPQAVDGLGCVAFRQGDRETAARLFQQAFDLDSTYTQALANLALVFEAQGREDSALVLYQRILAFDPQNAAARNNYSALLFDRQAQDQARDELLKAQALTQSALIEQNLKKVDSHRRIQ